MAARGKSERSRRERKRQERPVVLVVCEGETELRYFKDVKQRFRASWLEIYKPHCNDPKGLVAAARRKKSELAKMGLKVDAWAVFDAESREEQESRSYAEAIALAEKNGMHVANSSPCFEYWVLLHYAPGVLVDSPEDAERELRKAGRIPDYAKPDLPLGVLWDIYISGAPSEAARRRRANLAEEGVDARLARPVTYVDELVDRLCDIAAPGGPSVWCR